MTRRMAREVAVQSLYHMEMNDVSSDAAIAMVIAERNDDDPQTAVKTTPALDMFIAKLVTGVWHNKIAIDELLVDYLQGWKMDRLSRVDHQILRLATFEMVFEQDSPAKVAVNEAIDLAKHFGTDDSGKFVNGVLGKMIKEIDELKDKLTVE